MSLSETPNGVMEEAMGGEVAAILRSLTPEEIDMLRDTFIYMDRDSDGFVSREEMMATVASCVGAERFQPLQEYLAPLFEVADKDHDDRLSLTEFLMAFADGPGVVPAEVVNSCVADVQVRLTDEEVSALQNNFNLIDTNQDGVVDAEELEVALRTHLAPTFPDLTDENFKEIVSVVMASADADQNGVISLSEFIRSYQEDQGVLPATYLEPMSTNLAGARQLTDEEEMVLREAFAVLDRNNDGFVDLEDIYHALWDTLGGATEDQSQIRDLSNLVMMSSDRSKSGRLTIRDFINGFLRNIKLMQIPVAVAHERVRVACAKLQEMQDSGELERLVKVFEDLDSDGDGFVVRSELVKVLKALFHDAFPGWNEEMLNSIMTAIVVGAETNNGGRLSLEEFIRSFVEGSGVLPPDAVKKWDSVPRRGSYCTGNALTTPCYRSSIVTDADISLISEALGRLYTEKGPDGVITEEELHSFIAQVYIDDPNRGEEMFHFSLQQFVMPHENGGLTWSANVLFDDKAEEGERGVTSSKREPSDAAARRSSSSSSHQPRSLAFVSAKEVIEPSTSVPSQTAWASCQASPKHQTSPPADTVVEAAAPQRESSRDEATSCIPTQRKILGDVTMTPAASAVHRGGDSEPLTVNELCGFCPNSALLSETLKRQFEYYDVDHKGYLNRDTFKKIYATMENYGLDPSPIEVDRRFHRYSRIPDKIFFNEFCVLMLQRARL
ncbi:calmodulin-related protein, putative [Leishmania tarentolae]|uniref:Calmodulin-related protein, putative n=1 Tax=Leishmania tarentolae TaxID=5689 RepID=A0A640KTZ4_LEITA|nr:calmodulin-related protein, putative [Leishmania tarentolae]